MWNLEKNPILGIQSQNDSYKIINLRRKTEMKNRKKGRNDNQVLKNMRPV